jgi:hypothetical protein
MDIFKGEHYIVVDENTRITHPSVTWLAVTARELWNHGHDVSDIQVCHQERMPRGEAELERVNQLLTEAGR